jgi:hypothetical protein
MYARITRIELRRSSAPLVAGLVAAVGGFLLYASQPPYLSWMGLVVDQRDGMQLIWPLGLGLGAWQALREWRSRVGELFASTARPRWLRVPPILAATGLAALAGYLVMLAAATGHVRFPDSYFPVGAVPVIAIGALSLVAAVWLGLAVGSLLPSPLTPPLLVVAGFAGLAILPPTLIPHEDKPGTALLLPILQRPREGAIEVMTLSLRGSLTQALWLTTVAATGVVLFAAAGRRTRAAAVLPAVLGAAIAVPAAPRHLAQAWVPDRAALQFVCSGTAPTVCVPRIHAQFLDELRAAAHDAVTTLGERLPPAPTRVMLYTVDKGGPPAGPRPADTLMAAPMWEEEGGRLMSRRQLDYDLLTGAGIWPCPPVTGAKVDQVRYEVRYLAARYAVARWLLDDTVRVSISADVKNSEAVVALVEQVSEVLRALPPDEQRARVTAYRTAELNCTAADRVDILAGPGRIT